MKRFTQQEIDTMRRLFPTHSHQQIAQALGRPVRSVSVKCSRLGLKHAVHPAAIVLTIDQRAFLRREYPHIANSVLASILGVSVTTIVRIARRMRLAKTPEFMAQAQAHCATKAQQSHLAHGTYPPKGVYSDNLRKGEPYQFKKRNIKET